jgi:hypothetical protein
MASKRRAAVAAGKSARNNPYLQRLVEDEDLRDNLRTAYESSRKAYGRMSNGKGPAAALDDKKTQKELREAVNSLRDAAETLRGAKKKRRGPKLLVLLVVGAVGAMVASEGLRNKVLDALFGAEEEFEYTSTTTPETPVEPVAPPA